MEDFYHKLHLIKIYCDTETFTIQIKTVFCLEIDIPSPVKEGKFFLLQSHTNLLDNKLSEQPNCSSTERMNFRWDNIFLHTTRRSVYEKCVSYEFHRTDILQLLKVSNEKFLFFSRSWAKYSKYAYSKMSVLAQLCSSRIFCCFFKSIRCKCEMIFTLLHSGCEQ